MRYMNSIFLLLLMSTILLFQACNTDSTSADGNGNSGTLTILLTDAPADYDSVVVTFSEISAHIDSDWVHVSTDTMSVDLLELTNGNYTLLAENDIPAGKYTQIRLKIISAVLGRDGQVHDLDIPSGSTSGLKLKHNFTIAPGAGYELALDFDAEKSIVIMGPKTNPNGYKLKPVINLVSTAISGSISGQVTNITDLPYVHVLSGIDTVGSVYPNASNGYFMLPFISEGFYTVTVKDTLNKTAEVDSVKVIAGENTDIGNIVLQ